MRYSKLKNELEVLELKHKHENALLKMNHEQEKSELLNKCTHTYDDTSAKCCDGVQLDLYYKCEICGKNLH